MIIAEITIVPSGIGPSVSAYVARAQRVIEQHTKVRSQLTPMSTILEGELDDVLAVIRDVHNSTFDDAVTRVLTLIKMDDRRDKQLSMQGKLDSVAARMREQSSH
jgi:uncharacterized protein (TIGR00106 family)